MSLEAHNCAPPPVGNLEFRLVRVVLGLLLLATAGLKAHGLALDPLAGDSFLVSPRLLIATIEIEIILGLWLLSGWWVRAAWVAALAFFGILAGVSFYLGLTGLPSCGCLGRVTVSPWWTFALDVTAVAALALWRPARTADIPPAARRQRLLMIGAGSAALLALVGGTYLLTLDKPMEALARSHGDSRKEFEIDGLVIAADSLDLGQVWEDRNFVWRLPIKNRTGADIKVQDIAVSCGCCEEVIPRSLTVPAGLTEAVTLKLNLSHRTSAELGKAERSFAVEVTPLVERNRRPGRRGWELHGIVRSRVTADILGLQFGDTPVYGQPAVTRKVVATVHVPAQRLEAVVDPEVASAEVRPWPDAAGTFELAIAPQPFLAPGPFRDELTIELITPGGERLPGTTLPIAGVMQPEIRPLPARVLFGSKPIGETPEAFVVLQAPDGVDLAVERIEVESPDVHVEPAAVEGSPRGRTYRITQHITREGSQSGQLRLVVRKSGQDLVEVPVEVSYTGLTVSESSSAAGKE